MESHQGEYCYLLTILKHHLKLKIILLKFQDNTIVLRLYYRAFDFQNNPKNLDPSYKMDLDFWDCLGRVKLVL